MKSTTKPVRRVSFQPIVNVREFGNTAVNATIKKKFKRSSSLCTSHSVDNLNTAFFENPSELSDNNGDSLNLDESTLAHVGVSYPWDGSTRRKRSKKSVSPIRKTAIRLLRQRAEKRLAVQKQEKMCREIKSSMGVIWKPPTALKEIRQDWRYTDEMESDGNNPADNELAPSTQIKRKKRLLTTQERYTRAIASRKRKEERKREVLRKMYCKENVIHFIEMAKKGKVVRSLAAKDNDGSYPKLDNFTTMRHSFVMNNTQDTRKTDFKVKAYVTRRIKDAGTEADVRTAYEVVLENYHSVLGPHLAFLFIHRKEKYFNSLERTFLLDL